MISLAPVRVTKSPGSGAYELWTFRRVVQRREFRDFRSPEVGISGEEVDLTIGFMVLCILNRHELQKDEYAAERRIY